MLGFKSSAVTRQSSDRGGFTLIELMIAISIIAIMSTVAMVTYTSAQKGARDGKRKTDVSAMVTAVELFKQSTGAYPAAACVSNASFSGANVIDSKYINKVPTDPTCNGGSPGTGACGCGSSGFDYYFGKDSAGRIFFLANTEAATDVSTCNSLSSPTGVAIGTTGATFGGHLFQYCYAP